MLGKNFSSPLPSAFDSDGLPTVFSEYFLRRRSAPSETIFLLQTQLFSLMPLSPEIPYRPLTFVTDDFVLKMIKSTPVKSFEKNYRPITNLPYLSKILEKVVLHNLLSHLQANNLCNPCQSAYRAGHSTETVLLRVVNDILSALDLSLIHI